MELKDIISKWKESGSTLSLAEYRKQLEQPVNLVKPVETIEQPLPILQVEPSPNKIIGFRLPRDKLMLLNTIAKKNDLTLSIAAKKIVLKYLNEVEQ